MCLRVCVCVCVFVYVFVCVCLIIGGDVPANGVILQQTSSAHRSQIQNVQSAEWRQGVGLFLFFC